MIINLLLSAVAVLAASYVTPGVTIGGFGSAVVVAVVLGLVNAFVRPVVSFLSLPLNILTLGLFSFVISALMVMLTSALVSSFQIAGLGSALIFALVLSIVTSLLFWISPSKD